MGIERTPADFTPKPILGEPIKSEEHFPKKVQFSPPGTIGDKLKNPDRAGKVDAANGISQVTSGLPGGGRVVVHTVQDAASASRKKIEEKK